MATTFADHGTLVADTVTTKNLTALQRGFRIQNTATTGTIRYRYVLGAASAAAVTNPTVADQDGTYTLPAGACDEWEGTNAAGGVYVKMISSGTPTYAVEAI